MQRYGSGISEEKKTQPNDAKRLDIGNNNNNNNNGSTSMRWTLVSAAAIVVTVAVVSHISRKLADARRLRAPMNEETARRIRSSVDVAFERADAAEERGEWIDALAHIQAAQSDLAAFEKLWSRDQIFAATHGFDTVVATAKLHARERHIVGHLGSRP